MANSLDTLRRCAEQLERDTGKPCSAYVTLHGDGSGTFAVFLGHRCEDGTYDPYYPLEGNTLAECAAMGAALFEHVVLELRHCTDCGWGFYREVTDNAPCPACGSGSSVRNSTK